MKIINEKEKERLDKRSRTSRESAGIRYKFPQTQHQERPGYPQTIEIEVLDGTEKAALLHFVEAVENNTGFELKPGITPGVRGESPAGGEEPLDPETKEAVRKEIEEIAEQLGVEPEHVGTILEAMIEEGTVKTGKFGRRQVIKYKLVKEK